MASGFVDTNILVYAFSLDSRATRAEEIVARNCDISVQNLSEFANVARRKLNMRWDEIHSAIASIVTVCGTIHPTDTAIFRSGLFVAERYRLALFDAIIVASALNAKCDILYSEDMQHGQIIESRLRICNPFLSD